MKSGTGYCNAKMGTTFISCVQHECVHYVLNHSCTGYKQLSGPEADLAAYLSILFSQDLGVIPPLAHKVEAAHYVGVVTVARLHSTLHPCIYRIG